MTSGARTRIAAFVCLVLTMLATPSSALLVQPVYLDMRYTGTRSNAGLRVVNDRARQVSVEVTVNRVDIPERGPVVFTPIEGDDFLIFPAVGNIPPNGTQVFRVRWIGEPMAESRLFALTTSELPVEIDTESRAAVQLLYAIQTIVAIGPQNARPDLSAAGVERAANDQGVPGVRILFMNEGNLHGQVKDASVVLSTGSWRHVISPTEFGNAVGLGMVKPNGKRWMFVAVPDVPAEGELAVEANIPTSR
jgi:fimbrial chaperone protein